MKISLTLLTIFIMGISGCVTTNPESCPDIWDVWKETNKNISSPIEALDSIKEIITNEYKDKLHNKYYNDITTATTSNLTYREIAVGIPSGNFLIKRNVWVLLNHAIDENGTYYVRVGCV